MKVAFIDFALGIVFVASLETILCLAFQPTLIQKRTFKFTIADGSRYNDDVHPLQRKISSSLTRLHMGYDFDSDEEDEEDYIDDEELGDWRSFRNTLVDSGLSSETSEGYIGEETVSTDTEISANVTSRESSKPKPKPKSVSKANEELLKSQSKELAKEYTGGVWAHEASFAEVGGLVVRLPLEVEIYRGKNKLSIGKELKRRLEKDEDKSAPLLSNEYDSSKKSDLSFSIIAVKTLLWYRKAQWLIEEEMETIAGLANEKGEINPKMLEPKAENLLKIYLDNQESWQEVCIVAKRNELNGSAVTYALNRPMAFKLRESLARLVLFGAHVAMSDKGVPVSQTNKYSKFLRAFEASCAVYVGGPDKQDKKAVMIHGIASLEGAEEIAPGTGIFIGGIDAAVEGVLDGTYKPLDFRFIVGCNNYTDGDLDVAIYSNKYQPIACARSLALKQCIQLPKPLWHEVLELCGGELREISRLEMMKRDDIKED